MNEPQPRPLRCIADFSASLENLHLISVEVGPRQELYALALAGSPEYRETRPSGTSFAKLTTSIPHDFIILRSDEAGITRFDIRGEHWNYHFVQPLPGEELLLVCARCRNYGDGKHDMNARVYDREGRLRREFLLGDGISRVQTTADSRIWVGYFDEGVFGNFGWTEPVGASGLLCWDAHGRRLFEYQPPDGMDSICDCYALNVVSDDEVWLYYYTDFPLVRIRGNREIATWNCPLTGSDAFAVQDGVVLFRGGYNQRDVFHLFDLADASRMTKRAALTFTDESRRPLKNAPAFARGRFLYLLEGRRCYRADVRELA